MRTKLRSCRYVGCLFLVMAAVAAPEHLAWLRDSRGEEPSKEVAPSGSPSSAQIRARRTETAFASHLSLLPRHSIAAMPRLFLHTGLPTANMRMTQMLGFTVELK